MGHSTVLSDQLQLTTHNTKGEFPQHNVKRKKPDTKGYIHCIISVMKSTRTGWTRCCDATPWSPQEGRIIPPALGVANTTPSSYQPSLETASVEKSSSAQRHHALLVQLRTSLKGLSRIPHGVNWGFHWDWTAAQLLPLPNLAPFLSLLFHKRWSQEPSLIHFLNANLSLLLESASQSIQQANEIYDVRSENSDDYRGESR